MKDRITERLEELGVSARAASLSVGSSPDLLRIIINGYSKNPRSDTVEKIARALGLTEQWLLTETGPKESAEPPSALTAKARASEAKSAARSDVAPAAIDLPREHQMVRDIPIMGTAAGSATGSFRISDDPVDWARRLPGLVGARDVYGLFVAGDSMSPKFDRGDLVFVHPHRPCVSGDTVILQTQNHESDDIVAFIKILVVDRPDEIICRQLNPDAYITYKRANVVRMHRVMTTAEIAGL